MTTIDSNSKNLINSLLQASEQMVLNNSGSKFRNVINRKDYTSTVFKAEAIEESRFSAFSFVFQREYGPYDKTQNIEISDKDEIVKHNNYSLVSNIYFKNKRDKVEDELGEFLKLIHDYGAIGKMGYNYLTFPELTDKYNARYFSDGIRLSQFRRQGVVSAYKFVIDFYNERSLNGLGYWDYDDKSIYKNYNRINRIRIQELQHDNLLHPIDEFINNHLWEQLLLLSQITELVVRSFSQNKKFEVKLLNILKEEIIKINEDRNYFKT